METQSSYFENDFLKQFEALGQEAIAKYSPLVRNYVCHVIPFESKRMKQNQSLMCENSTLAQDKVQLLGKIEHLRAELDKDEYLLENQRVKINELERSVEQFQNRQIADISRIEKLEFVLGEKEASIAMKVATIHQLEKDLSALAQNYEGKNDEYNTLLSIYMKEKNMIAEKLNNMNQLEQILLDKEKQLREDQFYLQKQWEKFKEAQEEAQKEALKSSRDKKSPTLLPVTKQVQVGRNVPEEKEKIKESQHEILRQPIKKIFKHHQSEIYACSMNFNGNLLATCGGDRQVKVYDVSNQRSGITISNNSAENICISLELNYGGERLLTGSTDKTVTIYHSESGKPIHTFLGHGDKVNAVAWTSVKERCVSGSDDKQLKIWEIEKACNLLSISCGRAIKVMRSSMNQPVVYTGHSDGSVRIYSITQGNTPIASIKGIIDYPISSISLLTNRYQALISSTEGSTLHLLDLKMNKSLSKYEQKDFFNTAAHADLTPSENYVLAGNCDGNIYYWDRHRQSYIRKVSGHEAPLTTLKYHPLTSILVSADKQGNVILWQ